MIINKALGRGGAEALVPYVRGNSQLRALVLTGANLGADGMSVLGEVLETNSRLTVLDVSRNELGAYGAKAVAKVLARSVERLSRSEHLSLSQLHIPSHTHTFLAMPCICCTEMRNNGAAPMG